MPEPLRCEYQVDSRYRISRVGETWNAFARENKAPELTTGVIGRSLYDFIADEESRHLYGLILSRVRETSHPSRFSFRCDSPVLRRFMEMTIHPEGAGAFLFSSVTVRTESRAAVALLDAETPRTEERLPICGWCKKVFLPKATWVEVEEAVSALGLFDNASLPELTHTICPACDDAVRQANGLNGGGRTPEA